MCVPTYPSLITMDYHIPSHVENYELLLKLEITPSKRAINMKALL